MSGVRRTLVLSALLTTLAAPVAFADTGSVTAYTRPDGKLLGSVQASWSSCSSAGDCSWQVGVANNISRYQPECFDQPDWTPPPYGSYDKTLTWVSPVQPTGGTLSLRDLEVGRFVAYYYSWDIGDYYCLYGRGASTGWATVLLGRFSYPPPVLDPEPTVQMAKALLTKTFGRRFTYAEYRWMEPNCGRFPPKGGRSFRCPFEWRNNGISYSGDVWYWPLDGGLRGQSISVCGRPVGGAYCAGPDLAYSFPSGGPGQPPLVPDALRDPGGPFASFPSQTLRPNADGRHMRVRVRCELPRGMTCSGTLRLVPAHGRPTRLASRPMAVPAGRTRMLTARLTNTALRILPQLSGAIRAEAVPQAKDGVTATRILRLVP